MQRLREASEQPDRDVGRRGAGGVAWGQQAFRGARTVQQPGAGMRVLCAPGPHAQTTPALRPHPSQPGCAVDRYRG